MKVLIIDDSDFAVALAKTRLATENIEICSANSGQTGLAAAKAERPDIILLDVEMPDIGGFDVCRALKDDPDLCMIPIIFLSASKNADDMVKGLDVGGVDYITKPFDAFELRARVRAALRAKQLQDMLIQHAHIDPLTGLFNRRALTDRLNAEWQRARNKGGCLSFIMIDVDNFKSFNDEYGHAFGDEVLRAIAAELTKNMPADSLFVRYGGEEFVVLCPGLDVNAAADLAEKCRRRLRHLHPGKDRAEVSVTASFGVADNSAACSPEELIHTADNSLYLAKTSGRNRVCRAQDSVQTNAD